MDNGDIVIKLTDIYKSFKIYQDKGSTLKDLIVTRGRSKFNRHQVLNGINLSISKGEVVGLIGENGSGKSTALKLISQIMYPDKGYVNVKGRVSSLIELGAGFHQDLSGRENIYTNASIFGLSKREIDKRLNDIIDFSELWDFMNNPIRTYSSGMYMRLAFSVAINVDADILLIDEILAVGDKNFQKKCIDRLKELKKKGTTIIIVTHDTSSVEDLCSRAVWINEGLIAADGVPELVINKYYEYMYEKQFSMEKRLEEERYKAELLKKDFTRKDIIDLYHKYLQRDPDDENTFDYYFKNFDKKRDIEHYLKHSPERMAIELRERNQTVLQGISRQDVIDTYKKYLFREPENERVIEDCCRIFRRVEDLEAMIIVSQEYKMLETRKSGAKEFSQNILDEYIVIEDVYFRDTDGAKTLSIKSGQAYDLIFEYKVCNQQDGYAIGVEIYAFNGYLCYKHDTRKAGLVTGKIPSKGSIVLKIARLPLFRGKYKLFAFAVDQKGTFIDQGRFVMEFGIDMTETQIINGTWKVEERY